MGRSILKVFKSFVYAGAGIIKGFAERNMRVHGIAAFVVIVLGFYFGISELEWVLVLILMGLVWSAELVNSAIEELANLVRDELGLGYRATKRARDLAAGAVLVLATVAAIIGGLIFLPRL